MSGDDMTFEADLHRIATEDVAVLVSKDKEYGGSWKKRGGVGAYMMAARKYDRIEVQAKRHDYDIFAAIAADTRSEGLLDDIRDLRRYLMLIEREMTVVPEKARIDSTGQDHPFGYDLDTVR